MEAHVSAIASKPKSGSKYNIWYEPRNMLYILTCFTLLMQRNIFLAALTRYPRSIAGEDIPLKRHCKKLSPRPSSHDLVENISTIPYTTYNSYIIHRIQFHSKHQASSIKHQASSTFDQLLSFKIFQSLQWTYHSPLPPPASPTQDSVPHNHNQINRKVLPTIIHSSFIHSFTPNFN